MGVQNSYNFTTRLGQPGGIVDLAPYAVDSFINEAENGAVKFGMGVVRGTTPGKNIKAPETGATADTFEGIVTNRRTNENGMFGGVELRKGIALGIMRWGRIYGLLAEGVTPAYGDAVYLVVNGDDAGCFTNTSGTDAVAVKGRFLGAASDGVAEIELFNQAQA